MTDRHIDIRASRRADWPAITALLENAFDTPDEARLAQRLESDGSGGISLVAMADEVVCGYCLLSKMRSPTTCLGLAPLAVADGWRHRGLGRRLVTAALQHARSDGWQAVFVLGEPGWYGSLGFSREKAARFRTVYPAEYFLIAELCPDAADTMPAEARYAEAFDAL